MMLPGSGWGYISAANYRLVMSDRDLPRSLDALQQRLFGGIQYGKKVDGDYILNNRVNYYHKPVYSMNWYWNIDDRDKPFNGFLLIKRFRWWHWSTQQQRYPERFPAGNISTRTSCRNQGYSYDWNSFIQYNTFGDGIWEDDEVDANQTGLARPNGALGSTLDWNYGKPYDLNYSSAEKRAKAIVRASVNSHKWYGAISTFSRELGEHYNLKVGLDARHYQGQSLPRGSQPSRRATTMSTKPM